MSRITIFVQVKQDEIGEYTGRVSKMRIAYKIYSRNKEGRPLERNDYIDRDSTRMVLNKCDVRIRTEFTASI
jgi:hypothetical protein